MSARASTWAGAPCCDSWSTRVWPVREVGVRPSTGCTGSRCPQEGLLIQLDGSHHLWLGEEGPQFALLFAVDDATGAVVNALLCEKEDSLSYFRLLQSLVQHRENVIAVGNSGTGKTHVDLGLRLAACQRGMSVGFTGAAGLVHELMEARDERRLMNLQRQLSRLNLLIIDELRFVPLSRTGAELLFEVFSQRYEQGSTLVTTNLPFDEWTEVFCSEPLTGALLDRLTHHAHILEMNGENHRLKHSRENATSPVPDDPDEE